MAEQMGVLMKVQLTKKIDITFFVCFNFFYQCTFFLREAHLCVLPRFVPVSWSGEHPQDYVPAVHPDNRTGGVEQVKVEVGITRDRAVQTSLQERCPLLLQDSLRPTLITFTHPGHS